MAVPRGACGAFAAGCLAVAAGLAPGCDARAEEGLLLQVGARNPVGQAPSLAALGGAAGWRFSECAQPGALDGVLANRSLLGWMTYGGQPWLEHFARVEGCSLPSRGRFESFAAERGAAPCATACYAPLGNGTAGTWVSQTEWRPAGCSCSMWYSTAGVHRCLAGRALVFQGDSLTRQLFTRLISWLRDLDVVVEHHFHRHAAYRFDPLGDELTLDWFAGLRDSFLTEQLEKASPGEAHLLFREQYSDVRPLEETVLAAMAKAGRLAGVVSGKFGNFELRWPAGKPGEPWKKDTLSLDEMNDSGGAPHYYRRNSLNVGASTTQDVALDLEPMPGQYQWDLPGGWSSQLKWRKLRILGDDDAHFQCTFAPPWPADVAGWKMPFNGDCRDIINLNAVQALLGRICGG